ARLSVAWWPAEESVFGRSSGVSFGVLGGDDDGTPVSSWGPGRYLWRAALRPGSGRAAQVADVPHAGVFEIRDGSGVQSIVLRIPDEALARALDALGWSGDR
ncbi:MAG TPA: hypothetical protein VEI02_07440, partial [Planctomycetota bacterium]|nr:hypothetical protein [Planctomycetota bacterium]